MNRFLFCYASVAVSLLSNIGFSQSISHSDVFFTYGESKIEIAPQEGLLVIPQVMPEGGFFAQANSNPGFFSERDVGGGTAPNDVIGYNVLDDLVFWSDGEFTAPKIDTNVRVLNIPRSVEDTVIATGTGEQRASFDPLANSIGQSGPGGDFHAHVDFRLEPNSSDPEETPAFGAYGLKLSLSSDNPSIEESDPFFIVFQFGIEDDQFATALSDFDALLSPSTSLPGDFNFDGALTDADIDLLSAEVRNGTNDAAFDLTEDSLVDDLDRTNWVEQLAGTLFGDSDLNGRVEFADFLALSAGFGTEGGWANGDFDGNGEVQFPDFLTLSTSFGTAARAEPASQSVPEPKTHLLTAMLVLTVWLRPKRRTRSRYQR